MRDLFITLIVLSAIPVSVVQPFIGLMMWVWLSLMSPHRLSWGFAYDFPFVEIMAILTMVVWLCSRERKIPPINSITVFLGLFIAWGWVTTYFAIDREISFERLIFVTKIFTMAYFVLAMTNTRERIHVMVWVVVLSIGFYGVKGGLFTILTGGAGRVYGPAGSFIAENNAMALALITIIPLIRYLQMNSAIRWVRWCLGAAILLCVASVLGSYSRGALLGVGAMLFVLGMRTRRKWLFGISVAAVLATTLAVMPAAWYARMDTINEYEEDYSAQGRLAIWGFATDVALQRPLGGGYQMFFSSRSYEMYGTGQYPRSAHSIVFQVLGEHGFFGLFLFLGMLTAVFRTCGRIRSETKGNEALHWVHDLASMLQTSLVGFCVSGLFLNLAYFDLLYMIIGLTVALRFVYEGGVAIVRPRVPARVPFGARGAPVPAE